MERKDLLQVYAFNLSALLQAAQSSMNVSVEVGDTPMQNYMLIAMQPWKFLLEQVVDELEKEMDDSAQKQEEPSQEPQSDSLDDLLERLGDNGDG